MKFNLLDNIIEISEGSKNYMKIVTTFRGMAERAVKDLDKNKANFLMNFYDNDPLDHFFDDYIVETRKYLTNYGVYTLSDDTIFKGITVNNLSGRRDKTFLQSEFDSAFDDIVDAAPNYESENDRTCHIVKKSLELFDTDYFETAVWIDIMSLCDFAIEYLRENELLKIQVVYQDDSNKAKAIYENLTSNSIPESSASSFAVSLIELDFSKKDYYVFIFNAFPQSKFEIAAITNYLGIDISDLIEKEIKRDFDLKTIHCEEDALKMMDTLKSTMEKFLVTSSSRKTELERMLHDFDIKARTYDGILYDTRELCSQAEKDDNALFEMHGNVDSIDKDSCNRFLSEIAHAQYITAIKNKHLQLLNDRITFIDNEYLENLLSEVENYDEAKCNCLKDEINQYDAPEEIKSPYIARIEKRIYTIWDTEDFEKFTGIFLQTPVSDSEQIGKSCVLIRNEGRTETKELFIKALYLLNNAEVEAAAKYATSKEGGLFASIINMGKKETYEILTLGGRVLHPAIQTTMETLKAKKGNGVLSSFGFGKNKSNQQPIQTQAATGTKFCSACGAKTDGVSKFCSNCGNKLN